MTTHIIRDGEAVTDCCHKTPFELPRTDQLEIASKVSPHVDCPEYGWKNAVEEK
jgi:hypothetical protein